MSTPSSSAGHVGALVRLLPVLGFVAVLGWRLVDRASYDVLVDEDGPVEWATALAYLAAAVVAAGAAVELRRRRLPAAAALYLLAALALLGVAGEEVSWGQRVLGFAGPDVIVENNKQDEANLHNLLGRRYLHAAYILVGLYGAGLGRAVVARVRPLGRWSWLLAPGPALRWYFLTLVVFYVWFEVSEVVLRPLLGDGVRPLSLGVSRMQEVVELGLGVGVLLFVLEVRRRARERHDEVDPVGATATGTSPDVATTPDDPAPPRGSRLRRPS